MLVQGEREYLRIRFLIHALEKLDDNPHEELPVDKSLWGKMKRIQSWLASKVEKIADFFLEDVPDPAIKGELRYLERLEKVHNAFFSIFNLKIPSGPQQGMEFCSPAEMEPNITRRLLARKIGKFYDLLVAKIVEISGGLTEHLSILKAQGRMIAHLVKSPYLYLSKTAIQELVDFARRQVIYMEIFCLPQDPSQIASCKKMRRTMKSILESVAECVSEAQFKELTHFILENIQMDRPKEACVKWLLLGLMQNPIAESEEAKRFVDSLLPQATNRSLLVCKKILTDPTQRCFQMLLDLVQKMVSHGALGQRDYAAAGKLIISLLSKNQTLTEDQIRQIFRWYGYFFDMETEEGLSIWFSLL
jgi:hypothetical protein